MQEGLSVAEAFEVKLLRQVALAGSFGKRSMGLFAKVGGGCTVGSGTTNDF